MHGLIVTVASLLQLLIFPAPYIHVATATGTASAIGASRCLERSFNSNSKSPLVTMGCPTKSPLLLRRYPPLSNTPIPRPTSLTNPNGIQIQSAVFFTIHPPDRQSDKQTDRQTDRRDRRQVCGASSCRLQSLYLTRSRQ